MAFQDAKQSDLTKDAVSIDVVLKDVLDLLDSNNLVLVLALASFSWAEIVVKQVFTAFLWCTGQSVFNLIVDVSLVDSWSSAVADNFLDLVVGFDFNAIFYLVLEARLLDLLHRTDRLLELAELDLLHASRLLFVVTFERIELEDVLEFFYKHFWVSFAEIVKSFYLIISKE